MKNMLAVNRVENEVNQWRTKEERFGKLFSFSLSSNRPFLKEKLSYYEGIAAKYKNTKDIDERFALRLLKQETLAMEKQLYPNPVMRILRRLFVMPIHRQIAMRNQAIDLEKNSQLLQIQLQRAGFSNLSSKLEERMNQGQQQFSIPLSFYVNEKERLDHQLSFLKDHTGQYKLDGFKTKLHNETRPDEKREQYFGLKEGMVMNADQAYNLLKGRAIQQEGRWLQLDMNDKDSQGNYRFKEFHSAYGFDLEETLNQLPLKELQEKTTAGKLADELKKGNRQAVNFIKDGNEHRYYIEVNPQFKTVNIYDAHSRKITLATAMDNKTIEAVKVANKVNDQEIQRQSKRNSLRIN